MWSLMVDSWSFLHIALIENPTCVRALEANLVDKMLSTESHQSINAKIQ
jgi:hypothetical protein